jgi:hypothetical protein
VRQEAAMLSERDRQVLNQIELALAGTDPKFVAGLRSGRPHRPREYRLTWAILLTVLGVGAFVVAVSGNPIGLLMLAAVGVTGLFRFVSRRLDQAARE